MTIDEAIAHAKDQSEIFGGKHKEFLTNVAEWLEELKNLKPSKKGFITIGQTVEEFEKEIRAKAIDEFAEKLKETLNTYIEDAKDEGDYTYIKPFEISKRAVNEVTEELKAGGENE